MYHFKGKRAEKGGLLRSHLLHDVGLCQKVRGRHGILLQRLDGDLALVLDPLAIVNLAGRGPEMSGYKKWSQISDE